MDSLYSDYPQLGRPASADQAMASALSRAIHKHRLAPGTKLGEDDLAEIYGVSRTVVRRALHSLSHGQLINIRRNRGACVARPSVQDAEEVFEARESLEPRTARSAALNATPADVALLAAHLKHEHAAVAAGEMGRALFLSGRFHIEIARMANQATIAGFVETLIARSLLVIALYRRRESALCESHAHQALIEAIAQKDAQNAQDLMRTHLVDLHATLDLRHPRASKKTLKDILL